MSAGTRRNGSSKVGPFTRTGPGHRSSSGLRRHTIAAAPPSHDAYAAYVPDTPDDLDTPYESTGRRDLDAASDTTVWEVAVPYGGDAAYDDASHGVTVASGAEPADAVDAADDASEPAGPASGSGEHARRYAGRHASPRRKTAGKRARKAVPAAVVAAAVAAGAAAYTVVGSGHPQAAQLSGAMSGPLILSRAAHGTGQADTAASAMVKATKAASSSPHEITASPTASPSPSASRAAATATATASPSATTSPSGTASPSPTPAASTLSCNLSDGLLPANVTAIVSFLLANGYTDNAAAGIAGNIYQESKGDPESVGMGGGGLIGWTPLPSGYITGDPTADLQTQLAGILAYNEQWASYLPELNSAASPSDAAYIYVTDFERAGIPAAATRETSAEDVATACGI